MTQHLKRPSRRTFLLSVGAAGAAGAAALAMTSDPESPEKGKDKRASRGYHASEHINNYYRTTKV